jgi:DNA-binding transcriptional LysR family regulator
MSFFSRTTFAQKADAHELTTSWSDLRTGRTDAAVIRKEGLFEPHGFHPSQLFPQPMVQVISRLQHLHGKREAHALVSSPL